MPQAAQGSGYTFQSFLKKNQKRISTAIPHAKPIAVKKTSVMHLPKRVVNFNSPFARKLTTLEFNDKLTIIVSLFLGGEKQKWSVRTRTMAMSVSYIFA